MTRLLTTATLACLTAAAQAGEPGFTAEIDGEQAGVYVRPHVVLTGPLDATIEHSVERPDGFVCPDAFVIGRSRHLTLLYVGGEPASQVAQIAPVFTVGDEIVSVSPDGSRSGKITDASGDYIQHTAEPCPGASLLGVADFLVGLDTGNGKAVHCQAILAFLRDPGEFE